MVLRRALDTEGLEQHGEELFRCKDDGTVQVRKWITDVQYVAFQGLAKACMGRRTCAALDREGHWQNAGPGTGGNVCTTNTLWKRPVFLKHVLGETGGGAITFTYISEHCKLFPVEDFRLVGVHKPWRK